MDHEAPRHQARRNRQLVAHHVVSCIDRSRGVLAPLHFTCLCRLLPPKPPINQSPGQCRSMSLMPLLLEVKTSRVFCRHQKSSA